MSIAKGDVVGVRHWKVVLGLVSMMALLQGCEKAQQQEVVSGGDPEATIYGALNVNKYPMNKLVCDPFDEEPGSPRWKEGLKAELFYLRDDQPRYKKLSDYFANGEKSDKHIFFSKLYVPTRIFTLGFPLETGGIIGNDSGETLHEYFALRMQSTLKLGSEDQPGVYQLALLSDDGSILRAKNATGEMQTIVANDGDHASRFGCGNVQLELNQESRIPIELEYYQGPRYRIALIPMWRRVSDNTPSEPLCGKEGVTLYFDTANNSQPQPAYLDLLARGWKPLAADNYLIEDEGDFNPCQNGQAPVISNLKVMDNLDGQIKVTWKTDIPATSQIRFVDMSSGAETLTKSDTMLRTSHEVIVTGFLPGVDYLVQAVSVSETYGKAISSAVTIRVQ